MIFILHPRASEKVFYQQTPLSCSSIWPTFIGTTFPHEFCSTVVSSWCISQYPRCNFGHKALQPADQNLIWQTAAMRLHVAPGSLPVAGILYLEKNKLPQRSSVSNTSLQSNFTANLIWFIILIGQKNVTSTPPPDSWFIAHLKQEERLALANDGLEVGWETLSFCWHYPWAQCLDCEHFPGLHLTCTDGFILLVLIFSCERSLSSCQIFFYSAAVCLFVHRPALHSIRYANSRCLASVHFSESPESVAIRRHQRASWAWNFSKSIANLNLKPTIRKHRATAHLNFNLDDEKPASSGFVRCRYLTTLLHSAATELHFAAAQP